jgi:hypothetical protein
MLSRCMVSTKNNGSMQTVTRYGPYGYSRQWKAAAATWEVLVWKQQTVICNLVWKQQTIMRYENVKANTTKAEDSASRMLCMDSQGDTVEIKLFVCSTPLISAVVWPTRQSIKGQTRIMPVSSPVSPTKHNSEPNCRLHVNSKKKKKKKKKKNWAGRI